jgi:hypothetical protein
VWLHDCGRSPAAKAVSGLICALIPKRHPCQLLEPRVVQSVGEKTASQPHRLRGHHLRQPRPISPPTPANRPRPFSFHLPDSRLRGIPKPRSSLQILRRTRYVPTFPREGSTAKSAPAIAILISGQKAGFAAFALRSLAASSAC